MNRRVVPLLRRSTLVLMVAASGGLAVEACSSSTGTSGSTDAAVPDAAVPDAAVPDPAVLDAAVLDAAVPDAAVPDAAVPDAAVPDAAVPDAAVRDAAVRDAAVPDAAVPDAAVPDAALTGCGPGGRYTVQSPPTGPGCSPDGSGRVLDNTTGLTWMAKRYYPGVGQNQAQAEAEAYCSGQGMRLPTKDEALGIAGTNYTNCAFPCGWVTWTSSAAGPGLAWYVYSSGGAYSSDVGFYTYVLCVQ